MSEVGVEILKTEETENNGIKYFNINVSDSEVERNPDIVRLCADAGILEYVKSKTGHWIKYSIPRCGEQHYACTLCGYYINFGQWGELYTKEFKYCPHCGARMVGEKE